MQGKKERSAGEEREREREREREKKKKKREHDGAYIRRVYSLYIQYLYEKYIRPAVE
jgi:hypothetical protein